MLIGLADIAGQLVPGLPERYPRLAQELHKINGVVPGTGLSNAARTAGIIIGLLLLMLSHGLRRRKRRAWQAVMLLLAVNVVLHVLHLPRVTSAVVPATLLVILWCFRGEFYAVGDPRTRRRALRTLPALLGADVLIGLAFIMLSRDLAGPYTLGQRLQSVIYGLAGISGPVQFTTQDSGDLFTALTAGLGLFAVAVTAYLILRPAGPATRLTQEDACRIRALLDRHGENDSLGYFALRDDKSVIWSPTGKSCIGYRVVSGVMLASGDPLGDPEAWPGAIRAFLDEAARHAWVPAVMGCSELGAEVWCREGGLTALEIGDEAVVEVAGFALPGPALQNVREMAGQVRGERNAAEVRRVGGMSREEVDQLVRQAGSWRGSLAGRGFSMALGRVRGCGDECCVVATAIQDGALRVFAHFVPWGADGLSLDLMHRDRSAPPGLEEFLIAEVIQLAHELGVKRISLNFAVFRAALELGERIGAGPALRAWRGILLFLSRWLQIESRYKFNARFCPVWEPRFFVYPGTGSMPRVAVAALEAEAFLARPRLTPRGSLHREARVPGPDRRRSGARQEAAMGHDAGPLTALPAAARRRPRRMARTRPVPGHGRARRHSRLVPRWRAPGTAWSAP